MIHRFFSRSLAIVTLLAGLATAAQAAPFTFAPHKALYDIKLSGTKAGSQIVNITGQMLYEWQPTCDAWISNHRFTLDYDYADSPAMHIASDFSTYEPFDGNSIDFTSQRKRDGELVEELRGSAEVDPKDRKGAATYTLPRGLEFDLPAGSLFPMGHTQNVLQAIADGKKIYSATVFDGSDADGPTAVNAVIGKPLRPEEIVSGKNIDAALLKSPAHKVRLAFFPLNDPSEAADYEMDTVLHDNGIISDMYIEYDDFSVTQKLIALEPLPDLCKERAKDKKQ